MDALECLKTRRSVRKFRDTPIPEEVVEDLIDCARMSPTGRGVEPWEFVTVRQPDTRATIAETTDFGSFIAQAPVCIAVLCRDTTYYIEDGAAATTSILLAAWAHGLGTCWVAGDKKPYADEIRSLLGAPDRFKLVSLIAAGYPAEAPSKQKRAVADMIHWDRF